MSDAHQANGSVPLSLAGIIQHYDWGRPAGRSIISKLSKWRGAQTKPLAEIWFGSHPKAPALVDGEPLDQFLREHAREILGARVCSQFGSALPFLLKVLSIGSPLSIQAHPDQVLAKRLHAQAPNLYPDDQHKPEIAIAISEVQALYGFLSAGEIAHHLQVVPELAALTKPASRKLLIDCADSKGVQAIYRDVVTASNEQIATATQQLLERIKALPPAKRSAADRWVSGLAPSYPEGDVGLFCFYLLRLLEISPGKALFTAPNVPHAYLTGELVECMAMSDNVVRGGLTKKPRDVETLISMLSYEAPTNPLVAVEAPDRLGFTRYRTPAKEFSISCCRTAIRNGKLTPTDGPVLLFCLEGEGELFSHGVVTPFDSGSCFLLPETLSEVQLSFSSGALFMVAVPR